MDQLINGCRICLQTINHEPIKLNRSINDFLEKQLLLVNICRIQNDFNRKCFLCAKCFNRLSDIHEFYEYCIKIDKYWQKIFDEEQDKLPPRSQLKEVEFLEINDQDSFFIEYPNSDKKPEVAFILHQEDKDEQSPDYTPNNNLDKSNDVGINLAKTLKMDAEDSLTILTENEESVKIVKDAQTNSPKSFKVNQDDYFMELTESLEGEGEFSEMTYYEQSGDILKPISSADIMDIIIVQDNDSDQAEHVEHVERLDEHYIVLEDPNNTELELQNDTKCEASPDELPDETYESTKETKTSSFLVLSSDEDKTGDDRNVRNIKSTDAWRKNNENLRYKILSNEAGDNADPSGRKQYQCLNCEKQFDRLYDIESHVNIHDNLKPFVCHICGRGFRQKNILITHQIALHYGKKVECPDCGKKFSRRSQLILHNRVHRDEKPFQCDYKDCTAAFRQRQHLVDHKNIHTDTKSFYCRICNKAFHMRRRLQDHLYKVHSNHRYRCNICLKNFLKPHMLKNHFISVHKIEVADVSHLRIILDN